MRHSNASTIAMEKADATRVSAFAMKNNMGWIAA